MSFSPEGFAFGLLLVALGVLATLANLGQLDLHATLRTWWPASLIVWGAAELFNTLIVQPFRRRR